MMKVMMKKSYRLPRRPLVVLFARQPCLGRVKTRLAKDIGLVAASRFYRWSLFSLARRLARDKRWIVVLAVTPDAAWRSQRSWPLGLVRYRQGTGTLGQRMERFLSLAGRAPVIILGTDAPDIVPYHIASASRLLGRHDVVFGPALDGGYWLIGVRRRRAVSGLFQSVRWSTEYALSDTLANLGRGLTAGFLEKMRDIDDAVSYRAWMAKGSTTH